MHVTDDESPFKHIYGSDGDDILKAVVDDSFMHAFAGDDVIYGSKGKDIIYGNGGNDFIYAGNGDDILHGGDGDDFIDGGKGNDFFYGGLGADAYALSTDYGRDVVCDNEGLSTITISEDISVNELEIVNLGDDIVISIKNTNSELIITKFSENPNNYVLKLGNDFISIIDSISSGDIVFISGTDDNDYIVNIENSIIAGGTGDDRIIGAEKDEYVFGDRGNDQLLTYGGNDIVLSGNGNDYINAGDGNDIVDNGEENDYVEGGDGDDIYFFNTGYGMDSISDCKGVNTIVFGDNLVASSIKAYRYNWNDLLITFDNFNDSLILKNYCIDNNYRNYHLVFSDGVVVYASEKDSPLRKIYGTDGSEYMESIYDDGIINDAQKSNDQIVGSEGNDMLYGGDGDERIIGKAGDDILEGGAGNDYLNGETGNDTYIFSKGYGVDTISDGMGVNNINIYGYRSSQIRAYRTNWNDITITFEDSKEGIVIEGFFTNEANRNFYFTFNGTGKIHATAANSPLRTIYGTETDDYIAPIDNKEIVLYGLNGIDNLNGGNGADKLYGGKGNDQLYGNGGNDVLDGGEADDILYGGAGNDVYTFDVDYGWDTIVDSEGINTICFGDSLSQEDLTAYRHNWNDLLIIFENMESKLVIQGYFSSENNRKFDIKFSNGESYSYDNEKNPIKQIHATEYDDWMNAWTDNGIILHGDGGNDNLSGSNGDDVLYGDSDNDTLNGNAGNDILDGGAGDDFLYGGEGDDIYNFDVVHGLDFIEDFEGINKIRIHNINSNEVFLNLTENGELVISFIDCSDILIIRNYNMENFMFEFSDGGDLAYNIISHELEEIYPEQEVA